MANIKSAKKRILVNEKKRVQNTMIKTNVKSNIKKVKVLAAEGKKAEAEVALNLAFARIDHAASCNVLHKNNAAHKKAQLAKTVSELK